jgi:hypothetical protein
VADCFLDLAFAFFRCTLYMFVVHITPLQSEMRLSPDRGRVVTMAFDTLQERRRHETEF